jgi:3-dehydrotetronate 4-kinase
MSRLLFGAVADDDTGATDLAGMLADQGLRTVLIIDLPVEACFQQWTRGREAVIVGTGTRALPPAEAYGRTRAAIKLLERHKPRVLQVKYCSTFDSTEEGNIGPSLDAAMDETGELFTVALPALPVNGRTTYMGYHFVGRQLLSDSPMRRHPLTPMTNSHLVSHLQPQTRRRVGLAPWPVSRAALDGLRAEGVEIAVLDCIGDADLESVCEAIADLGLISGSSAPAMKLPAIWRRRGWREPSGAEPERPAAAGRGFLIVAGSCSEATARQNAWLEARGTAPLLLDPVGLAAGAEPAEAIERAVSALREGRVSLLRTASLPGDIERVRAWSAERGLGANETGLAIARTLSAAVRRIVEEHAPAGLIVAGGETAGAVCRALELGALDVGRNIEPGVPLCFSLGRFRLPVALKSGNFGSADFYMRAMRACEGRTCA